MGRVRGRAGANKPCRALRTDRSASFSTASDAAWKRYLILAFRPHEALLFFEHSQNPARVYVPAFFALSFMS
jgi:hypothetical protein